MKRWLSKIRFNSKAIILVLFGYIIAQFLWWEVLLVRQNLQIVEEKQKLMELSISDNTQLKLEIEELQKAKINKTLMIVGEGTIFLLLLLYGINLIRKANKRERDFLDQKNNFLLSITHELKTPLATTKLQLQTLKKHQLSINKQLELIEVAINESNRLNALIDNVLLATRMQQNDYVISKENTNLSEFISTVLNANYKREIDSNGLKLDIEQAVYYKIDKIAFPSIITNLVDNAFKYSNEVIDVRITLKKNGNTVVLNVMDKGIGINDNEKEQIFNQFYRSGSENIRRTKGTGLGLFIVKYLVEKHSGTVSVKNNNPEGSIFEIVFSEAN